VPRFGGMGWSTAELHWTTPPLIQAGPLRRVAQPTDIAPAVVFLASDEPTYITGQALSASGGLTMC
jgi:NAD(P)-dependent dehydrogenase (short-subunit alcohol dehydrogenase family)